MERRSFRLVLGSLACAFLSFVFGASSLVMADVTSVSVSVFIPECNDILDNDSDTLVDYPDDPGCTSFFDNDETDPVTPACGDGSDNDSDGRTDFPDDLGCDSSTDSDESGEIGPALGGGIPGSVIILPTGTQVIFKGAAFSGTTVTVLADGVSMVSGQADKEGNFILSINEITPGFYIFNLYATLQSGRSTRPVSYALRIARGSVTEISGIRLLLPGVIELPRPACAPKGDLNDDCLVDLIDFSILAYWWQRQLDRDFLLIEERELSGDGKVELEDFSILAYHWTG